MRVFTLTPTSLVESDTLPTALPSEGYVWIACARREFEVMQAQVQQTLHTLCGATLVDLHVKDLLSNQLPSHYDYTSQYDVLVFRRLAAGQSETDLSNPGEPLHSSRAPSAENTKLNSSDARRSGPPVLRRIDTSPVAFALFDRVLLSVHPADCAVRDAYAARLLADAGQDANDRNALSDAQRGTLNARIPNSAADLMVRMVNTVVDGYLDLRRELTRQLDHWQQALLQTQTRFNNWNALLDARMSLHQLEDVTEDQSAAIQDWIDALETWPIPTSSADAKELELLKVRSRDVREHIERVTHHVHRLEQSVEAALQMHFSIQSHLTNDIMRTLTAITAVFLPLNLITGFFGMNFEFLPLIHTTKGLWFAIGLMLTLAITLVLVFWRKRYLKRTRR